ncbi:MAG: hypothetical protein GY705_04705 [Bacteroidetes bacterium]|nr:hypothetical protein [Bacteroidota bacterium]
MQLPRNDQLYDRVQLLYVAEQSKDWSEWSSLLIPAYRPRNKDQKDSFANSFFKTRDFRLISWRIDSIRQVDSPTDIAKASQAISVAVRMDVTIEKNGVEENVADQTDYWVFLDGEWCWFWRGWPND